MQTYTHIFCGLVLGEALFPGNNEAKVLAVIGSGVIDIPNSVKFTIDKIRGKKPFAEQSRGFILINNIVHSLFLCLPTIFFLPFFIGVYSHLMLDWISHKYENGQEINPTMVWPLPGRLNGLFNYKSYELFDKASIIFSIIFFLIYVFLYF